MKLIREYTTKVIILIICFVILLELFVCFYIYRTSYNIFEIYITDTLEKTKKKTTEFTQTINKFVVNLLMNYITKLKLIAKSNALFNGKIKSKEKESINKNSKFFSNNNLRKRILKADVNEIYNINSFKKLFNKKTEKFDYIGYYLEKFLNERDNDNILKYFQKEENELNYISYYNISGPTNLENLSEDSIKKLNFFIPMFKTILLQRFIEVKSLMDIKRIYILNDKELIIYPPEDINKIQLNTFYTIYPESRCYIYLGQREFFLCAYNFTFNYLYKPEFLDLTFIEFIDYQIVVSSVCLKIPYIKGDNETTIVCIEIDFGEIIKSIPLHNTKTFNFGFFNPADYDVIKQIGENITKYHIYDIYIIQNSAREAYSELHEVYHNNKTTPNFFILDDNNPLRAFKYYSLYHFLYFDMTKIINAHPDLKINITQIEEEYFTITNKIYKEIVKNNPEKIAFNKTTCREELIGNYHECFTDEVEMDIVPLIMNLNKINEDIVEIDEITNDAHNLFLYSITYTYPKTNRKDIKQVLLYKLIRIISLFLFMTLIIIAFFILLLGKFSNYSFEHLDNLNNYMNEITLDEENRKINLLKERINRKSNKEMIYINDIYDLVRNSLIIKESFENETYFKKHMVEFHKIVLDIKNNNIKEICNLFLALNHFKCNLYSFSEKELSSMIKVIKETENKNKIGEEYDKIKDMIKRSSTIAYLNEYSDFENFDENIKIIINLNIYKQRFIYLYAMIKYKLANEININKNKKNKEKRDKYFHEAIKYFKECGNINNLLGINSIKNIYSLIMISKCYLNLNDYKNSIIHISEALSLYFNFSKIFNKYQSRYYNPKIMLFIETNIYNSIIYTYSLICSSFNKHSAANFLMLKLFETSPFLSNGIHFNAGMNTLNFLEKNKSKMNRYDKNFYKNPYLMKEYDKNNKYLTKIVSRLYFKISNKECKNIDSNIRSESNFTSSYLNLTLRESKLDKSMTSSNVKGDFATSRLSSYSQLRNRRLFKNITICFSEKILENIDGQEFKDIIINYLEKYFTKDENNKFNFIQFGINGKKTLLFHQCPLEEFINKFHKYKYAFQSNIDLSIQENKSTLFMGLYDLFYSVIKNCEILELSDNIIFLFMASEDIRFSSVADCMNIVEELNKNNISVYFFCYDKKIDENKINNIQSFLNGLIEGYFFQIKNSQHIKEVFANISNINYQSNFFKFNYDCFDHNL